MSKCLILFGLPLPFPSQGTGAEAVEVALHASVAVSLEALAGCGSFAQCDSAIDEVVAMAVVRTAAAFRHAPEPRVASQLPVAATQMREARLPVIVRTTRAGLVLVDLLSTTALPSFLALSGYGATPFFHRPLGTEEAQLVILALLSMGRPKRSLSPVAVLALPWQLPSSIDYNPFQADVLFLRQGPALLLLALPWLRALNAFVVVRFSVPSVRRGEGAK
jgi:hypothetical protein